MADMVYSPDIVPILNANTFTREGYDFVGWTGTGIDTPTVSVTVAKGTEGDISLKANWVENGEFEFKLTEDNEDLFGGIFFGKTKAAFIINGEASFENNPSINASNYLVAQKLQLELYGDTNINLSEDRKTAITVIGGYVSRVN